jgi:hypothetical protein
MSLMPRQAIVEHVKRFLLGRKGAYARTFNIESRDAQVVLTDLSKFCRAHSSTGHTDPHMAARLDGRREVWLRIQQHLHLDDETLWLLYGGPQAKGE